MLHDTLQAAEGKLFGPLAYTKTFALVAALIFTLIIMPAFSHWIFGIKESKGKTRLIGNCLLAGAGIAVAILYVPWAGITLFLFAANNLFNHFYTGPYGRYHELTTVAISVLAVSWLLAIEWVPLGVSNSLFLNFIFILIIIAIVLGGFSLFIRFYPRLLSWCLENKLKFLSVPVFIVLFGTITWIGFGNAFGFVAK